MKKILLLAVLWSGFCFGQDLNFNTRFFDAVDKWVAFEKNGDQKEYGYGFIYIDEDAGFTFDYTSDFKITDEGFENISREFQGMFKSRLTANTANVHILTDRQIAQLQLPAQPEWLEVYKRNENELSYLVKIGSSYNHVGASINALKPLSQVYAVNPHYEGVEFELAYAYNATENYEKAFEVLTKAIGKDPKNFLFFKELGFASLRMGKIEKAEETYKKGIALTNDNQQKSEMALNMTHSYFLLKNRAKFDEWEKITKKYMEKDSQFNQYLDYFKENWGKK